MSTTFNVPKNNANGKLAAAISAAALSLSLQSGEGARFPSTYPFNITIDNEILKCTNRSTDTLTVVRAQESTSAAAHSAGANVQLNITAKAISDLNTAVNALEAAPPAHKTSHQDGGSDEISVAALSGLLADSQTPLAHKTSHQDGGSDQVSVAGLTGLLATSQTPIAHATNHQSGGSDAIKLDDLAAPDDNTDLNASITKHGLLKKLDNNSANFLNGQGAWAEPPTGGPDKSARVTHSVAQSIADATYVYLAFDSERFDTDTIHDNVTNNSRLTCKTAGKYFIAALVGWAGAANGNRLVYIRLNQTTDIALATHPPYTGSYSVFVPVSCIYNLVVGDYVEVVVYQSSGGAINVAKNNNVSPEFMMIKLA